MKARTIPGTRKLHSFIPVSKDKLQVKQFSASSSCKEERVTASEDDIPPESISGFVTCLIDRKWWLACVLCLSPDESQVKLKLLHPPGPASSFKYPPSEPTITIAIKDVLTIVDPRTRTGRVYTLSKRGQISFTEIRDIVRDTLDIAVLVTVYTILPLLHNHVLLLVKAVNFLDDMTIVVESFYKPIEIPKPDSGNQYINVLKRLCVKMKRNKAAVFERSEVKV